MLIERAGALLRQPGPPRRDGGDGGGDPRSHDPRGEGNPADDRIGLTSRRPTGSDTGMRPIAGPIVERKASTLQRLLRVASLGKIGFIAASLLFFAASAAAIFSLTPRYTAIAVIATGIPGAAATRSAGDRGAVATPDPAVFAPPDYLRSRATAEAVMDYLRLWSRPEFDRSAGSQPGLLDAVEAQIGAVMALLREWRRRLTGRPVPEKGGPTGRDAAVAIFLSKLTIDAKPNSPLVTIRFEDRDPPLAVAAANAMADQYVAQQKAAASGAPQQAREELERAAAAMRQRVAQSDQAYKHAREAVAARGGQEPRGSARTESASAALAAVTLARAMLEARLAAMRTPAGAKQPDATQTEAARQTAAVKTELKAAVAKEAALRRGLAAGTTGAQRSSPGQAKFEVLRIDAGSNRAALTALQTRLNDIMARLAQADAKIVAPARVPREPAFPDAMLLLAVAAVGSTVAGFGVAVAREKLVPTFHSGEEIETETETGIRTFTPIPLTTLLLRQRSLVIVVTSARADDGKTTLATNLAAIAANTGRRVLLVDADLRTAGASRILRMAGRRGLAELILGGARFAEVVAAGAGPLFDFLPAGTASNVAAARSGLERIGGFLPRLREQYDLIVVDSPAALAGADTLVLPKAADAAGLAVRRGSTPRAAVRGALRRLHEAAPGAWVGIVLTAPGGRARWRRGEFDPGFHAAATVGSSGSSGGWA